MEPNALKAIRKTNDEFIVGNYIVLFGGRDLEGVLSKKKNKDGTVGEFFTAKTALESPYTQTGVLYVDWEHGHGQYLDGDDAPGPDVLGRVDWKTAKTDERGVWVERAIGRHNEYMAHLEMLIEAGIVGTSSQAVSSEVEIKADGEIVQWPLERDTLTISPLEPRMKTDNVITALKALGDKLPSAKAMIDAASLEGVLEVDPAGQENPQRGGAGTATAEGVTVNVTVNQSTPVEEAPMEVKKMSDKEKPTTPVETPEPVDMEAIVKALADLKAEAAEAKAYRAKLEAEPPTNSPGFVVKDVSDEADRALEGNPFKSVGEQLVAIRNAAMGYEMDQRLLPLRGKAILGATGTIASDGGFLIGTEQDPGLDKKVFDSGVFASRITMRTLAAGTNSADFYGITEDSRATGSRFGGIRGYRVAEGATITASQLEYSKYTLKPNKYAVLAYVTDEALNDQNLLEQEIMSAAPLELAFMLDDDILNGVAAGYPRGVLATDCLVSVAKETDQAADTIMAENIDKMWARRWIRGRYVWFINQDCNPQLDALNRGVGTGGALVYNPPGGIADAPYGRLKGAPVIETEFNPTLGDLGDILLADFSQYKVAQAGSMKAASSIHVEFLTDQTAYRFTARYDGQSTWRNALTPYKGGANTVSPFVGLAERA